MSDSRMPAFVLAACMVVALAGSTGCGEEASDYSVLETGDIPRPEFEFILDFDYWLDAFGAEDFIDPFLWDVMEDTGLTSLVRTNLIAYERGDHIAIECQYGIDDAEDKIIERILSVIPTESRLLGRINNESTVMSIYFSNGRETFKTFAKSLTDPFMVDALFDGDKHMAIQTRQDLLVSLGMIEGAILMHFGDEFLFAMFPNNGYPSSESEVPAIGVLIAPTRTGEPVAYDIANMFKSFGYLASLFSEELGDIDLFDFEETEVAGYPCVYLDLGLGEAISMVDADGYLFVGGYEGILIALDAFDRGEGPAYPQEAANAYCHINYGLINSRLLIPLYEAFVDPGNMSLMFPLPIADLFGPMLNCLIEQISELTEDADETIWADFSLRNYDGGFEIRVRMQTDLAEYSLQNIEASSGLMEKLFQYM